MPADPLGSLARTVVTLLLVLAWTAATWTRAPVSAFAHDIYFDLHSDGSVGGEEPRTLCCSGSEYDGDCEGIPDPLIHPDGSATFHSRRWHHDIEIAASKIVWMKIAGGDHFPAHFCGSPRSSTTFEPPDRELQIDPEFLVFCAFIDPGEV